MNADTKRHIDAARQVLVGAVPNPAAQIDQITNALIYKFMDDMDQSSIKAGGDPAFFIGDLERYSWSRLMDSKIGSQERMNLYSEALVKFSESKELPDLFRSIFKSAYLPYRSPEVLDLFLKEISYFNYSHSEELGNAYEYLLSVMSSQGDIGSFRTPRHIIDFIVDVVNPTKDEKIFDPACGTAGFLISAYKHILSQHDGKNLDGTKNNEKPLTPDQKKALVSNFEGYDISPEMVRLSRVNMYLHNFKSPRIYEYDTLSSDERWGDKFDVILANPPFMSPKGGIRPHSKFSIKASKSEVLFVDYIMSHLRPNGRAGIIVPEGIIFQSGNAYKQLRKNLVEDGLYAVVSLPSGVFNPYAGVKTSILLFDNRLAKQSKEILFVKIKNDGFDLGAQRRPIDKNDLPEAVEIINKWKEDKKIENGLASYIDRAKIAENGDYNLSADRYSVAIDYSNAKWPIVKLADVCEIYQPKTITSKEILDSGPYKVFGANGVIGYYDKYNHENSEVLLTCRGATCGTINLSEPKSWVTGNAMVLSPKDTNVLDKAYLFFLLKISDFSSVITGAAQPQITGASLRPFKIPLPPIEVQKQIVEELDGYQKIISGARQVIENWKPRIDIDPKWEKVMLNNIVENTKLGVVVGKKDQGVGDMSYIKMDAISDGFIDLTKSVLVDYPAEEDDFLVDGDFIYNTRNAPNLVGKSAVFHSKIKYLFNNNILRIRFNRKLVNPDFVGYIMSGSHGMDSVKKLVSGTTSVAAIYQKDYLKIEIPLPKIEIQEKIVEEIEMEKMLVESNRKLIDIYDKKIKDVVAKLWEK